MLEQVSLTAPVAVTGVGSPRAPGAGSGSAHESSASAGSVPSEVSEISWKAGSRPLVAATDDSSGASWREMTRRDVLRRRARASSVWPGSVST